MKVYVAIAQPDGDWDHLATLLGVYSTRKAAERRAKSYDERYARVKECTVDVDLDTKEYA